MNYDPQIREVAIKALPNRKYINITPFKRLCTLVARAETEFASIKELNEARILVAQRADFLNSKQRRQYLMARQAEISVLRELYDSIVRKLLKMGWV